MNKEQFMGEDADNEAMGGSGMPQEPQVPQGRNRRSDLMLPASIVIAAVLISGTIWYTGGGHGSAANPQQQANIGGAVAGQNIMTLGASDVILGNQNAPVTLIEYGDYQCPFCAKFFMDSEQQIRTNYVQSGKAKMVFRNLAFLGPESIAAASAAECAKDQNQFWAYHDALYNAKIQDTTHGGGESDGFFTAKVFSGIATSLKMDMGKFTQCIGSKKYDAVIANDTKASENAGVASTPTSYINGTEIKGAQPYATFAAAIDAAVGKK